MPRPKKVSIEDAVGSPKKAAPKKRGTNFFGRKNQAVKKVKAEVPEPTEVPEEKTEGPVFRNGTRYCRGVVIPDYPLHLRDPRLNENTPAVMQWYKDNHPKAYAALYNL